MNKMAKGAIATGLGVALLIGGGGTLAVWNEQVNATAGTIATGDLGVTAGAGTWTSNLAGGTIDLATYKIIPGETLTFSQAVTVELEGDNIEATIEVVNADGTTTGWGGNVADPTIALFDEDDVEVTRTLTAADNNETFTAKATFAFQANGVDKTDSTYVYNTGATDLNGAGFKLTQLNPNL